MEDFLDTFAKNNLKHSFFDSQFMMDQSTIEWFSTECQNSGSHLVAIVWSYCSLKNLLRS